METICIFSSSLLLHGCCIRNGVCKVHSQASPAQQQQQQQQQGPSRAPWLRPEPSLEDLHPPRSQQDDTSNAALLHDMGAALGGVNPPPPHVLDVQHIARALQHRVQGGAALQHTVDLTALRRETLLTLPEMQAQLCEASEGLGAALWRAEQHQQLLMALLEAGMPVVATEGVPLASMRGPVMWGDAGLEGTSLGAGSVPAVESAAGDGQGAVACRMHPVQPEVAGVLAWDDAQLAELVQQAGQRVGSSAEAFARAAVVAQF